MFENAFLGLVMVSDALEEHEEVIKELLTDPDFRDASEKGDLHLQTNCLLRIAREHQQPWFAKLQRRRAEQANQEAAAAAAAVVEAAQQQANQQAQRQTWGQSGPAGSSSRYVMFG